MTQSGVAVKHFAPYRHASLRCQDEHCFAPLHALGGPHHLHFAMSSAQLRARLEKIRLALGLSGRGVNLSRELGFASSPQHPPISSMRPTPHQLGIERLQGELHFIP